MPIQAPAPILSLPFEEPDAGEYAFQLERDGQTPFVLNASVGIEPQLGAQGLDGPIIDISASTPAGWDGELVDQISAEPREVFLPLLIGADDLMSLRAVKQSLLAYCNPYNGQVTLRCTVPDGSSRLIDGYYRTGIDGTMDGNSWWVKTQLLGIVLRCGQPFWRAEDDWTEEWKQQASRRPLLPILPLAPASSAVLNGTNPVMIDGDVPTYPVWTIKGPLESVQIIDVGTGSSLTLTASLGPSDVWTIDTRRGRQAVYDTAGTRQRGALNAGAQFWPLQPGLSAVQTVVTGADTGASVAGRAQRLWLAA